MIKLVAGIVILLIGVANILRSRRQPPLINAAMLGKLGLVGVGVGSILIIAGVVEIVNMPK